MGSWLVSFFWPFSGILVSVSPGFRQVWFFPMSLKLQSRCWALGSQQTQEFPLHNCDIHISGLTPCWIVLSLNLQELTQFPGEPKKTLKFSCFRMSGCRRFPLCWIHISGTEKCSWSPWPALQPEPKYFQPHWGNVRAHKGQWGHSLFSQKIFWKAFLDRTSIVTNSWTL